MNFITALSKRELQKQMLIEGLAIPFITISITAYFLVAGYDIKQTQKSQNTKTQSNWWASCNVITGFAEPSEPRNVVFKVINAGQIEIAWDPPLHPNGPLNGYFVSWECAPGEKFTYVSYQLSEVIPGKHCPSVEEVHVLL